MPMSSTVIVSPAEPSVLRAARIVASDSRRPSGWPAPLPRRNTRSSSQAVAIANRRAMSAATVMALSWIKVLFRAVRPSRPLAMSSTCANSGSLRSGSCPLSVQ